MVKLFATAASRRGMLTNNSFKMKIAFLTSRFEKPSYRFRVQQYIPFLHKNGVISDSIIIPSSILERWRLFRSLSDYDTVFLQKKLLRWPDRRILRSAARRLVYDVDDAVMYKELGIKSKLCRKRRRRLRATLKMSDIVLAGNEFLCRWAANYCHRAICFYTAVDTERYSPGPHYDHETIVIGWSGSQSTNPYLNMVLPVLGRLAENHRIKLRIVSDTQDGIDLNLCRGLQAEFSPWDPATEVAKLRGFDIGLMPLPDNEWSRGKCALKALLYMACGVPSVCSPVGTVKGIITDGGNGFTASSEEDWYNKLKRLITDGQLRRGIAEKGRKGVLANHSISVQAPRLLRLFRDLCKEAK